MKRILLDTNVVLDVLFKREPFAAASSAVWVACETGVCKGYLCAITLLNVAYIAQKLDTAERVYAGLDQLLKLFDICPVDATVLQSATHNRARDFEDAVQYYCAVASGLDAIVTRDASGFSEFALPVFTPDEFLVQLTK